MSPEAIANQTGVVRRGDGKSSGGRTVLHSLASRASVLFDSVADSIAGKLGHEELINILNTPCADGRGVVDLALATNVGFAMMVKKKTLQVVNECC